jgi:hypothetical protein
MFAVTATISSNFPGASLNKVTVFVILLYFVFTLRVFSSAYVPLFVPNALAHIKMQCCYRLRIVLIFFLDKPYKLIPNLKLAAMFWI